MLIETSVIASGSEAIVPVLALAYGVCESKPSVCTPTVCLTLASCLLPWFGLEFRSQACGLLIAKLPSATLCVAPSLQ
jgi:hypothetical protein